MFSKHLCNENEKLWGYNKASRKITWSRSTCYSEIMIDPMLLIHLNQVPSVVERILDHLQAHGIEFLSQNEPSDLYFIST